MATANGKLRNSDSRESFDREHSPSDSVELLKGKSVESPKENGGSGDDRLLHSNLARKPPVRKKKVEKRPSNIIVKEDSKERMRQETRLAVLEYLSSLSPERRCSNNQAQHRGGTSVVKARTIHSSERPFLDVIEKRKKRRVTRRNSEEYDTKVREKLLKMVKPLRQKLTPDILNEINRFDASTLRREEDVVAKRRSIPNLRLSAVNTKESIDSPIAAATTRLDEMSRDIMRDYPQLLDEHLKELLAPFEAYKKLTYEQFSAVAKPVFEKQLARFTGSVWSKVALVFYLVKEVLYSGVLTDFQVELLVDYATRFITETSGDTIKKEGGWVALEAEGRLLDEDIFRQDIYNPLGENSQIRDSTVEGEAPDTDAVPGYLDMAKDVMKKFSAYSAALAVGIGFAYAYLKQQ